MLYGGLPFRELENKFLMAPPCEVTPFTDAAFPGEVEIIPLPGHFFDMVGFRTPDDVVYLADCLSGAETLDKYQIGFIYDVRAYLETLDKIDTLQAAMFVPSHAEAAEDIRGLSDVNRRKVLTIAEKLAGICKTPASFENILQKIFTDYGLVMNFEQYVLVGNAIKSYLAYLRDSGKVDITYVDNMMLWVKI